MPRDSTARSPDRLPAVSDVLEQIDYLHVSRDAAPARGGHETETFWLTRAQAFALAMISRTPAEHAAHHARRKELYEKKHPRTVSTRKRGGPGRGKKNEPQNAVGFPAYAEDAAAKTGKSRDTVERAVKRGKDIPNVADLAGTSLDKGDELDEVALARPQRCRRRREGRWRRYRNWTDRARRQPERKRNGRAGQDPYP